MRFAILSLIVFSIAACSSDDDALVVPSDVSGAITFASSKISAIVPDTSGVQSSAINPQGALTTPWTTAGGTYAIGGDFGESPRDYVLVQGDGTEENGQAGLVYRLNQIVENLCLFNVALPNTAGIPDLSAANTTTLTAEVKAEMATTCNIDVNSLPPDDTVVGYQVDDLSAVEGSEYDRRVSFDLGGGTNFTDFFHFTISLAALRFSYLEDGSNDSVAFFEYNPLTAVTRFEFSEANDGTFTKHYRGILDENTNFARFTAHSSNMTNMSLAVVSTVENGADELHVSYAYDDDTSTETAQPNDLADANACINSSTFEVSVDDTLSCTASGITGAASSSYTVSLGAVTGSYVTSRNETSTIQFTSLADILTAGFAD